MAAKVLALAGMESLSALVLPVSTVHRAGNSFNGRGRIGKPGSSSEKGHAQKIAPAPNRFRHCEETIDCLTTGKIMVL